MPLEWFGILLLRRLLADPKSSFNQLSSGSIRDRILDAGEIENIANGHGTDGIINGLVARWPMDDTRPEISGQDFFCQGSVDFSANSGSIEINLPTEAADGDTLLLVIASGGAGPPAGPENITTPAGWTHINPGQTDLPSTISTPSLWVYRKTASNESASFYVDGDDDTTKLGTLMVFKGIATSEDAISSLNTGTSASPVAPSVTAGGNAIAVRICVCDGNDVDSSSSSNFPAGVNGRKSSSLFGVGNGVGLLIATELVDAGSTGTTTFTLQASEEWGCLTITFLGGQGATNEYLKDYSDNALASTFLSAPKFSEEHPDIKSRRS